jgi:hypothetical protein
MGRKLKLISIHPALKYISTNLPRQWKRSGKGVKQNTYMDHYAGPATIIKRIGTRSFLIEFRNSEGKVRTFQRDVGMLSLIPARQIQFDPDLLERNQYEPHVHRSLIATPQRENEFVILSQRWRRSRRLVLRRDSQSVTHTYNSSLLHY